jgi:sulfite exporter TauE/SafE
MNALDAGSLSLGAALIAGLAGSGHCLTMCGGIAGALAMRNSTSEPGSSRLTLALAYNLARIASYSLAGALAGLLGQTLLRSVNVAPLSIAFRVLAGAIMVAAAGRLLFGWRLLDPLEAAGAGLWRKVMPAKGRVAQRRGLSGAIGLGLAWGWLPCGLSYSMLLLAATTASVANGALVMAAFGVGTLPAMVSATVAFERAAKLLTNRATLRTAAGSLLLAFGAWTAGSALYHLVAHGAHAGHDMSTIDAPADPHAGHDMGSMGDPAKMNAPADEAHAHQGR